MAIQAGDTVTIEYTGRLEDGTVFDTSRESVAETEMEDVPPGHAFDPLTVEIGAGRIIDGLEDGLIGATAGDTPTVTIPPADGYGEWSEEHVQEFERTEFDEMIGGDETPETGMHVQTQQGGLAELTHVDDERVEVDFNHELAGETLTFDVDIVAVE
jgi:FKBP-type peptidyl-prolyl cis-trans isomerase 2